MITLLNYFTFAEEDGGSGMYTPWIAFPSEYQTAEYWIDCKLFHSGSVDLTLESSVDGETTETVDGPTTVSAAGLTRTEVTEKLGSMVRLKLQESGGASGSIAVLSVWLVPKMGS